MIFLGLLLILGTAGLSFAVVMTNNNVFSAPAGAVDVLGIQLNLTVGQTFLSGLALGALALLGLVMLLYGIGRNARRNSNARHKLRSHRQEMEDLQREHDAASADLASRRAAGEVAAEGDGITTRR